MIRDPKQPSPTAASDNGVDRRSFLKVGAAATIGAALARPVWAADAPALPYQVTGWHGDAYETCHKVRDNAFTKLPAVSQKHDVVIVGSGIAGMTAAFKLRDLDVLVLEQDKRLGGMAKSLRSGEHEFNIGAAYFTGVEGEQAQLWSELGLNLKPVAVPNDRWLHNGNWIPSPWEEESIAKASPSLQKPMAAIRNAMAELLKGKDFPETPFVKASAQALKLDTITFAEWLKPWATPELMGFINGYCFSAMGASAETLSAFGSLNFYSEFLGNIYAFPEGNAHLIKVMVEAFNAAGKDRIVPGCVVYKIDPVSDDNVRVYYMRGEESLCVEAKRVIAATPYFVSSRILAGISDAQRYMLNLPKYAAYFVGSLVFDKVVSFDSYDSWVPAAGAFDDFIPTTWVDRDLHTQLEAKKAGQSISCFACEHRPGVGRWRMMNKKPHEMAMPIVEAFEKIVPGATASLREVHMTRWGHAIIINQPGMYTKWLPKLSKRHGPVYLAHSDGQGLPAVESSTAEAFVAAKEIRERWKK